MHRAVDETASLLRRLGHEVTERDPDYGMVTNDVTARYLRGVHDDAWGMTRPRFLERRTKRLARMGGLVPGAGDPPACGRPSPRPRHGSTRSSTTTTSS